MNGNWTNYGYFKIFLYVFLMFKKRIKNNKPYYKQAFLDQTQLFWNNTWILNMPLYRTILIRKSDSCDEDPKHLIHRAILMFVPFRELIFIIATLKLLQINTYYSQKAKFHNSSNNNNTNVVFSFSGFADFFNLVPNTI